MGEEFKIYKLRKRFLYRFTCSVVAVCFAASLIVPPQKASAQAVPSVLNLPVPGSMVTTTPGYVPTLIKGIKLYPDNPLMFDFVIDNGYTGLKDESLKRESEKLIKYFLATLTIPNDELWVNLSPAESDRIISTSLGDTTMGRDMLAQDYLLKQLTASLIYPEDELGAQFWQRVYKKAYERFGTTEIPTDTFNRVWVIPQKAVILEKDNGAYVIDSHLKVMLEEDYARISGAVQTNNGSDKNNLRDANAEILREIIIPEIEHEVNTGKTFANLRQIYHSMILATWYKKNLKQSLLGQVYFDQKKTLGVDTKDKQITEKIYTQYIESFKKGVYNYIREDYDPQSQDIIPRKYFSGGYEFGVVGDIVKSMSEDELAASPLSVRTKANQYLQETGNQFIVTSESIEADAKKRDVATLKTAAWQRLKSAASPMSTDKPTGIFRSTPDPFGASSEFYAGLDQTIKFVRRTMYGMSIISKISFEKFMNGELSFEEAYRLFGDNRLESLEGSKNAAHFTLSVWVATKHRILKSGVITLMMEYLDGEKSFQQMVIDLQEKTKTIRNLSKNQIKFILLELDGIASEFFTSVSRQNLPGLSFNIPKRRSGIEAIIQSLNDTVASLRIEKVDISREPKMESRPGDGKIFPVNSRPEIVLWTKANGSIDPESSIYTRGNIEDIEELVIWIRLLSNALISDMKRNYELGLRVDERKLQQRQTIPDDIRLVDQRGQKFDPMLVYSRVRKWLITEHFDLNERLKKYDRLNNIEAVSASPINNTTDTSVIDARIKEVYLKVLRHFMVNSTNLLILDTLAHDPNDPLFFKSGPGDENYFDKSRYANLLTEEGNMDELTRNVVMILAESGTEAVSKAELISLDETIARYHKKHSAEAGKTQSVVPIDQARIRDIHQGIVSLTTLDLQDLLYMRRMLRSLEKLPTKESRDAYIDSRKEISYLKGLFKNFELVLLDVKDPLVQEIIKLTVIIDPSAKYPFIRIRNVDEVIETYAMQAENKGASGSSPIAQNEKQKRLKVVPINYLGTDIVAAAVNVVSYLKSVKANPNVLDDLSDWLDIAKNEEVYFDEAALMRESKPIVDRMFVGLNDEERINLQVRLVELETRLYITLSQESFEFDDDFVSLDATQIVESIKSYINYNYASIAPFKETSSSPMEQNMSIDAILKNQRFVIIDSVGALELVNLYLQSNTDIRYLISTWLDVVRNVEMTEAEYSQRTQFIFEDFMNEARAHRHTYYIAAASLKQLSNAIKLMVIANSKEGRTNHDVFDEVETIVKTAPDLDTLIHTILLPTSSPVESIQINPNNTQKDQSDVLFELIDLLDDADGPRRIEIAAPQTILPMEHLEQFGFSQDMLDKAKVMWRIAQLYSQSEVKNVTVFPRGEHITRSDNEIIIELKSPQDLFGQTVTEIHLYLLEKQGILQTFNGKDVYNYLKFPWDNGESLIRKGVKHRRDARNALEHALNQFEIIGIFPYILQDQEGKDKLLRQLPIGDERINDYNAKIMTEQDIIEERRGRIQEENELRNNNIQPLVPEKSDQPAKFTLLERQFRNIFDEHVRRKIPLPNLDDVFESSERIFQLIYREAWFKTIRELSKKERKLLEESLPVLREKYPHVAEIMDSKPQLRNIPIEMWDIITLPHELNDDEFETVKTALTTVDGHSRDLLISILWVITGMKNNLDLNMSRLSGRFLRAYESKIGDNIDYQVGVNQLAKKSAEQTLELIEALKQNSNAFIEFSGEFSAKLGSIRQIIKGLEEEVEILLNGDRESKKVDKDTPDHKFTGLLVEQAVRGMSIPTLSKAVETPELGLRLVQKDAWMATVHNMAPEQKQSLYHAVKLIELSYPHIYEMMEKYFIVGDEVVFGWGIFVMPDFLSEEEYETLKDFVSKLSVSTGLGTVIKGWYDLGIGNKPGPEYMNHLVRKRSGTDMNSLFIMTQITLFLQIMPEFDQIMLHRSKQMFQLLIDEAIEGRERFASEFTQRFLNVHNYRVFELIQMLHLYNELSKIVEEKLEFAIGVFRYKSSEFLANHRIMFKDSFELREDKGFELGEYGFDALLDNLVQFLKEVMIPADPNAYTYLREWLLLRADPDINILDSDKEIQANEILAKFDIDNKNPGLKRTIEFGSKSRHLADSMERLLIAHSIDHRLARGENIKRFNKQLLDRAEKDRTAREMLVNKVVRYLDQRMESSASPIESIQINPDNTQKDQSDVLFELIDALDSVDSPRRIAIAAPKTILPLGQFEQYGFEQDLSDKDMAVKRIAQLFSRFKVDKVIVNPDGTNITEAEKEIIIILKEPSDLMGYTVEEIHLYMPGNYESIFWDGIRGDSQQNLIRFPWDDVNSYVKEGKMHGRAARDSLEHALRNFEIIGIFPYILQDQEGKDKLLRQLPIGDERINDYNAKIITEQDIIEKKMKLFDEDSASPIEGEDRQIGNILIRVENPKRTTLEGAVDYMTQNIRVLRTEDKEKVLGIVSEWIELVRENRTYSNEFMENTNILYFEKLPGIVGEEKIGNFYRGFVFLAEHVPPFDETDARSRFLDDVHAAIRTGVLDDEQERLSEDSASSIDSSGNVEKLIAKGKEGIVETTLGDIEERQRMFLGAVRQIFSQDELTFNEENLRDLINDIDGIFLNMLETDDYKTKAFNITIVLLDNMLRLPSWDRDEYQDVYFEGLNEFDNLFINREIQHFLTQVELKSQKLEGQKKEKARVFLIEYAKSSLYDGARKLAIIPDQETSSPVAGLEEKRIRLELAKFDIENDRAETLISDLIEALDIRLGAADIVIRIRKNDDIYYYVNKLIRSINDLIVQAKKSDTPKIIIAIALELVDKIKKEDFDIVGDMHDEEYVDYYLNLYDINPFKRGEEEGRAILAPIMNISILIKSLDFIAINRGFNFGKRAISQSVENIIIESARTVDIDAPQIAGSPVENNDWDDSKDVERKKNWHHPTTYWIGKPLYDWARKKFKFVEIDLLMDQLVDSLDDLGIENNDKKRLIFYWIGHIEQNNKLTQLGIKENDLIQETTLSISDSDYEHIIQKFEETERLIAKALQTRSVRDERIGFLFVPDRVSIVDYLGVYTAIRLENRNENDSDKSQAADAAGSPVEGNSLEDPETSERGWWHAIKNRIDVALYKWVRKRFKFDEMETLIKKLIDTLDSFGIKDSDKRRLIFYWLEHFEQDNNLFRLEMQRNYLIQETVVRFSDSDYERITKSFRDAEIAVSQILERNYYGPKKLETYSMLERNGVIGYLKDYTEYRLSKSNGDKVDREGVVDSAGSPIDNQVGGIDFNPEFLELQIKRDKTGLPLPLMQQPIGTMNIQGFKPVIINIVPISNLPLLLGIVVDENEDTDFSFYQNQDLPFDRKARLPELAEL